MVRITQFKVAQMMSHIKSVARYAFGDCTAYSASVENLSIELLKKTQSWAHCA